MGMSAQQMLQNDPEYLARQLAQQEIQRYQNFQNPQLGLAATSGAVLGRGLANLFGGRGFFEVSDPALRRVADTQRVFNEAMSSFDPANPAASYESMARRFSELGFGQQAMMAAQEAAKYRQQERTEARAERGLGLQERGVLVQEGQLGVTKDRLKFDLDNLARQNRLTDAQIKEINARIENLAADKYSFNPIRDALGGVASIVAINKTNPSDVKVIPVTATTPGTPGAATDPAAAARAELERRNRASGRQPGSSTPPPELPQGVSP